MRPDLLQPSIADGTPARPLYSTTALFVPAFFGGPVAAALVFGVNAWRAQRLRSDWPWIVMGVLLLVASGVILVLAYDGAVQPWMKHVARVAGIVAAGLYAWRHRPLYSAQSLFGVASPNGWGVGLLALAIGWGCTYLALVVAFAVAKS